MINTPKPDYRVPDKKFFESKSQYTTRVSNDDMDLNGVFGGKALMGKRYDHAIRHYTQSIENNIHQPKAIYYSQRAFAYLQ